MQLSKHGEDLIAAREGEELRVYKDSKGLPTMGIGHLLTAAERARYPVGTKITQAFSRQLFRKDIAVVETALAELVTVPLTQNQYDALVSLVFNIGIGSTNPRLPGGFTRSSVRRKLNTKDYNGAAAAILLWNKPPEIQKRRRAEYYQFKTPYAANVQLAPDPTTAVSAADASDSKGGGGTQTTPKDPPPFFTKQKLSDLWNTAMSAMDQLILAKSKVSSLSFNTAVPTKGVGLGAVILGFISGNRYELVVGLGLIALAATILYVSYRRKSNDTRQS